MTKAIEAQTTPRKPDGVLTTQKGNLTLITEIFFDHNSKETFQDKLIRAVLADKGRIIITLYQAHEIDKDRQASGQQIHHCRRFAIDFVPVSYTHLPV